MFGVYFCIYDFFTIFYNFSSNIQTSLRNISLECIIYMNFYRVFSFTISYDFSPLQMWRLPAQQPHGMAPLGNPLKRGLLLPNHAWMFVWSTPKIICAWSVICMNFYRVFSFMSFYDFYDFFTISHPTSKLVSETCLWSV